MARVVLKDVLDSWEAQAPPEGFAARVAELAAKRGDGARDEGDAARRPVESWLDAWEAQQPPEGFADRVMSLAARRDEPLRAAQPLLDAWEGERPPQGLAERVVSIAERRQRARTRTRTLWGMVSVAAMAAIVAGLLVSRLPAPGHIAFTAMRAAPLLAFNLTASTQDNPVPPEAAASMESAPRRSPPAKDPADKTARRRLALQPIARPAPPVARRTPELRPRAIEPEEPVPHWVAHSPGSGPREVAFDLAAYKRARTSALHREKRFNKTEGSGFGSGGVYRLAP